MANPELRVLIGADSSDLQKEIAKSEKQLKSFEKSAKSAGNGVGKFGKNIQANALPATQEFSRVIQDLPFGIQGVGNNIQQLTSNFITLSRNAGGARNAFKLMLSSLAGPGGLILVVSAVTSALTIFGDRLFKTKKEVQSLDDKLKDYVNTLSQVEQAQLKGEQSAAKELTQLNLLRNQIEDVNKDNEARVRAYNRLQKLYPNYLKNVKQEDALAGNLKDTYDLLSQSILKKAKAQAAADLITENTKKELVLQNQLAKSTEELSRLGQLRIKQSEQLKSVTAASGQSSVGFAQQLETTEGNIQTILNSNAEIAKEIVSLQKESLNLANQISEGGGILPTGGDDEVEQNRPLIKSVFDPQFKADAQENIDFVTNKFKTLSGVLQAEIKTIGDVGNELVEKGIIPINVVTQTEERLLRMRVALQNFNQQANQLISVGLANAFSGIGEAVGNALATGENALAAFGNSILNALGGFLSEMGKLMIQYGVAALAYSQASKALLNPLTAAPAAGALIAAGTVLTTIGSAISSLSRGGASASGDVGGGGTSSSSVSSTTVSQGGFGGGTVVFEIQGTKLVGVLSNTLQRNRNLGGTVTIG